MNKKACLVDAGANLPSPLDVGVVEYLIHFYKKGQVMIRLLLRVMKNGFNLWHVQDDMLKEQASSVWSMHGRLLELEKKYGLK